MSENASNKSGVTFVVVASAAAIFAAAAGAWVNNDPLQESLANSYERLKIDLAQAADPMNFVRRPR